MDLTFCRTKSHSARTRGRTSSTKGLKVERNGRVRNLRNGDRGKRKDGFRESNTSPGYGDRRTSSSYGETKKSPPSLNSGEKGSKIYPPRKKLIRQRKRGTPSSLVFTIQGSLSLRTALIFLSKGQDARKKKEKKKKLNLPEGRSQFHSIFPPRAPQEKRKERRRKKGRFLVEGIFLESLLKLGR